MKQKQIIEKVIEIIGQIEDVGVISATDFTTERLPFMVVVGIDSTQEMNVGLPDYKYGLNITIDCFVDDDEDGTIFHAICDTVETKINQYVYDGEPLSGGFGTIPIVGWLFNTASTQLTDKSNQKTFKYDLFGSF